MKPQRKKPHTQPHDPDVGRHTWQAACQGKSCFVSRAEAERVARRYRNRAYKCKSCGKYHVGRS